MSKDLFYWKKDLQEETVSVIEKSADEKIRDLQIYDVQRTAGSSVKLVENSELRFVLTNSDAKDIYFEFWVKSTNVKDNILEIKKKIDGLPLISFSQNEFGFISFPIYQKELVRNDIYLGSEVWNYVGVMLKNNFSKMT